MGLLQQVERMTTEEFPDTLSEEREEVRCADGYVRRSPVQPYYTPPGYRRRRLIRWGAAALAALIAALAAWGLYQSGLLRF
ncbi:MAG: hypothetical protein HFF73_03680 [Oscillospiraceae bacterium]|nr:hypothetical protein [Oscillospiraceae bacterium]